MGWNGLLSSNQMLKKLIMVVTYLSFASFKKAELHKGCLSRYCWYFESMIFPSELSYLTLMCGVLEGKGGSFYIFQVGTTSCYPLEHLVIIKQLYFYEIWIICLPPPLPPFYQNLLQLSKGWELFLLIWLFCNGLQ